MALVLVYFAGLVTVYVATIPVFEESDEAEHFLYVHSILENAALPVIQSREALDQLTDPVDLWNNHTHHTPLYYLVGAAAIIWSDRDDIRDYLRPNDVIFVRGLRENNPNKWLHTPYPATGDTATAVYVLRALNALIGAGTLLLIFLAARAAWNRTDMALFAALFTASIPSFIAAHASITNDPLVIFMYAAGILWLIDTWRAGQVTDRAIILMGLITAGAALAKLNGLTLFGVALVVLAAGVWRGRFSTRNALRAACGIALIFALLAGWWYLRNFTLYGDFFALDATGSLWGRDFDIATEQLSPLAEVLRIGRSFWLMIGYRHQPLLASDVLLIYGSLLILLGLGGLLRRATDPLQRPLQALLAFICGVAVILLAIGTRDVDISYGRILFPALPAFALLIAFGLIRILTRRGAVLALVPLFYFALTTPTGIIANYPRLAILEEADAPTGDLTIERVRFRESIVAPGDVMHFELTFAGMNPDNAYLLATAVDSITQERIGHTEVYPGIAPTDALRANGRYQAVIRLPLETIESPLSPRRLDVFLSWSALSSHDVGTRYEGPILRDPRYNPSTPPSPLTARFGEVIGLEGYELLSAGDDLIVRLWWHGLAAIREDWVLTLQMLDTDGALIAQADGPVPGYPTSRWIPGLTIIDERRLEIATDTPPGDYHLMLAWYRLSDLQRLEVTSESIPDQILPLTSFSYPFTSED